MEDAIQMAVVFGSFVLIARFITQYAIRKKLIEKGLVDEKVKYLFSEAGPTYLLSNVKWGIVLVAVGVGLFWRQFAPYHVEDSSIFGLIFILAGIGFLVYYFIAKSHMDKRNRDSGNM
jgi:hypothetical protein